MCITELDSCGWVRLGVWAVAHLVLVSATVPWIVDWGLGLDNNGLCLLSALTQVWSVGVCRSKSV